MYVSWDVESYLSSTTVWEVEWYQLVVVGIEFSLFFWKTQGMFGDTHELLTELLCWVPWEKYSNVCATAWMERNALIWSQRVPERMLPRDSVVLLRDFNTEILGRNSLPDLSPSGALALSFCAGHGLSIEATVFKHRVFLSTICFRSY